jgi:hypothetical protein
LCNKDFLEKGSATEQTGRFNSLNCLKGEVCADESAEKDFGVCANPLANTQNLSPHSFFVLWVQVIYP